VRARFVILRSNREEETSLAEISDVTPLSPVGECVMTLARKRGIRTQAALRRALAASGYDVHDRTLSNHLCGRTVVDPALPIHLLGALRLNKKERRELADVFTYKQTPRPVQKRRSDVLQEAV
jgi:hypothetical protein